MTDRLNFFKNLEQQNELTDLKVRMATVENTSVASQQSFDSVSLRERGLERVLAKYYFADDFNRPDTPGSNGPVDNGLGNDWIVTGPGYLSARINGGAYVTDDNVYAYRNLGFTPARMAQRFTMPANSRALVMLASPADTLFVNCIHINLAHDSLSIQKLASSVFTNIATAAVPNMRGDGIEHEFAWELTGTTLRTYIDGVLINQATDAAFPSLAGPYATWQQSLLNTGSVSPRTTFVEAIAKVN